MDSTLELRKNSPNRSLIIWLFSGCLLVLSMVVVGGITRLTHSGLSMVEWHLFMGSVPPLNETAWQEVFDKYQQFPEFQQLNDQFTLADFKSIFWWEYIHRLLGRMVGVVFLVPFLIFLVRKKLDRPMIVKLSIMFGMGAFQAFLGWFMVKSGLVKEPRVSHFRLAAHLITAFLTCTYIFWVALGEVYKLRPVRNDSSSLRKPAKVLFALLIIQIVWGAFVAGMRAGLVHNTFPMMDDQWVHEAAFAMAPWWENFLNGKSGVQLVHRLLAYLVTGWIAWMWARSRKLTLDSDQRNAMQAVLIVVFLQFLLGVLTLVYAVPLSLGVLHQVNALLLLLATAWLLHRVRKPASGTSGSGAAGLPSQTP